MARGNMIVTLVAQTKKFSDNLKKAGNDSLTFGGVVKMGMNMALGAITGIAGALILFLPNFIKMGEEARKSELRLANIAKQMGLFGDSTTQVTKRLSKYAEAISFATGVDDELVRSAESILLTFKEVGKSADKVGGSFDRATMAAVDLAAAGFGDVESNAKQLGKALQDPINGLTALRRAGVTFTQGEQEQIKYLVEHNNLLGAQEMVLAAIEKQVGGTATATASATDKMAARFESVAETLSGALLPAVDDISKSMADWLDSPAGKKAIDELAQSFKDFGAWIASPEGKKQVDDLIQSFSLMAGTLVNITKALQWISQWLAGNDQKKLAESAAFWQTVGGKQSPVTYQPYAPATAPSTARSTTAPGGVTVNVTGITPTAKIGTTVLDAVKNAQRLGAR